MIDMAQKQVSFVVDHVLQKGMSEIDIIIERLLPYASIFYIHTQTAHPIDRYKLRIRQSTVPNVMKHRFELLKRAAHHENNLPNTNDPLNIGLPTIVVNTDKSYFRRHEEIRDLVYL